jgi:UDPglucose--hexose-1-phosphate uridylyltransferase
LSAPEIRIDQLTGLRTILAPGRSDRPHGFERGGEDEKGAESCPFCEGREERTPAEVYAVRPDGGEPNTLGWTSRVVPNLYPALGDGEDEPRPDSAPDLFESRPAIGAHEVIVNAPEHVTAMAELSEERFRGAVATWRERMRAHSEAAYVQLVVNEGAGAGASLPHTHAQLYALPFVPAAVARERERAGAYSERAAGGGLLSDVLVEEVRRRERLVAIDDEAALICPWASRSPYELRIVPRRAAPRFEEDTVGAAMIRVALRLLAARFDGPPELNLWVATAPRGSEDFHWHVDIAPRLTVKAGFELGAGVDINIYPPERAAADLREAL